MGKNRKTSKLVESLPEVMSVVESSQWDDSEPEMSPESPSLTAEMLFNKKFYQHDAFDKSVFRDEQYTQKIVEWICQDKPQLLESLDIEHVEICPESYLDEELREYFVDVLYQIPLKTGEPLTIFILIELKTSSERFTMFQIVKYILRIWDRELKEIKNKIANGESDVNLVDWCFPPVLPVIIYHGEFRFTAPTNLADLQAKIPGLETYLLRLEAFLFDFTLMSDSEMPDDLAIGSLFRAMRDVFKKDVDVRLLEIYKQLYPLFEQIPEFRDIWQRILHYFITSSKHFTEEKCHATTTAMKEIRGDEMSSVETPIYLSDVWLARGFAKGQAEGKAEGKTEGEWAKSCAIARNLKRKGFDVVDIAEATGLSIKEVNAITE